MSKRQGRAGRGKGGGGGYEGIVTYVVEAEETFVSDCLAEAIERTLEDGVVQRLSLEANLDGVKGELDKLACHTRDLIW